MGLFNPISVSVPPVDTKAESGSNTDVALSETPVTLLPANANRYTASIYNNSNQTLFVMNGSGVTTSKWSVKILPDGYYEVPTRYVGIITGIWAAAGTGTANVTEFVDA